MAPNPTVAGGAAASEGVGAIAGSRSSCVAEAWLGAGTGSVGSALKFLAWRRASILVS